MAFYRCGGGGIPSSLKTDMNAVFNKKFGTAVDYPAEGWPDTVNLMGPLPEKTIVSSPIAHITDGADAVPLKSWEVEIAPTLTGKSAIECTQTGKNLLNFPDFTLNFGTTDSEEVENAVNFPVGQYTVTFDVPTNTATKTVTFVIRDKKGAGATQQAISYISAGSTTSKTLTFTATMPFNYFYCYMASSETTGNTITIENIMMVSGATSSPYVAPTAPTVSAVNLGRTIYGGTAEVVKGTCEPFNLVSLNRSPDHAKVENGVTINTQNENTLNMTTTGVAYACERLFYSLSAGTYTVKFSATSSDSFTPKVALYKYPSGSVLTSSFASNEPKTFTLTEETIVDIRLFASGNADTTIRTVEFTDLRLESGSTVHDYSPYFEPFTFTPIPTPETALGVNNFWADEGDSEVTYRRDIDLALGGQ